MAETTIELPPFGRDVEIRAASYREEDNTVEVIWTTGASVRRYSWREGVYYDEVLQVTASSLRLDRLNGGAPFLNAHSDWNLSHVIGTVVPGSAEVRGGKGYARIQLSVDPAHAGIIANIKAGIIRNISVGYRIHKVEKEQRGEGEPEIWRVVDWEPLELSAVPIPADAKAVIRSEPESGEGAEKRLAPCIVVTRAAADEPPPAPPAPEKVTSMSEKTTAGADDTRGNVTPPPAAPAAAPQPDTEAIARAAKEAADKAVAEDRARAAEIRGIAAKLPNQNIDPAFVARHADGGTSVAEFHRLLIDHVAERASKAGPTHGLHNVRIEVGTEDAEKRSAAMTDALLSRADPVKYKITDAGREFVGMSLLEMARDFLESRGQRARGMDRNTLAATALEYRSGMHSTSDFPQILANVANKFLRDAYTAMGQTFRPLVRVTSVPDFKTVTRVQLGEAPQFEKVNEHGEFKRGTIGEGREQYAIATYGKIVALTRQVIINDDLNAFSRVPAAFGVQAAQLESDLVWFQILGNPVMGDGVTLFHANHKNLGTAGAISVTTVSEARKLLSLQTGLDGKTVLGLEPSFMIVPPTLITAAEQFVGQLYAAKTADVVPNSLKRMIPISEPRLEAGVTDPATKATAAGSASSWYVAGSPGIVDIVELAYLEGNSGVYTETRQGFDVDGVELKVRLDAGAKVMDHRNIVRNPN